MTWRIHSYALSVLLAVWSHIAVADDTRSIPLRTHSISQPYLDYMHSRWFDYGGSTVIRTDSYIRLAGEHPSQSGWIFTKVPLTATNWEIEVEFSISGSGNLHGDGMAMWVTTSRAEPGPVFGMKDEFEGLGIFFDTYKNNRPGTVFPYVMAMMGDGKTKYDKANDGKANELAGCSARGIRNADVVTKAKVTYYQDKSLTLDLMYKNPEEWTRCFDVSNVKMPSVAYLGFSAETGELSDNHDIISVETKNLYSPSGQTVNSPGNRDSSSKSKTKSSRSKEGSGGGWGWFFIRLFLFAVLAVGGYVGYTAYRARRRDRF